MKIEGAIFDVDGTLLDSMHIWRNVGAEYLMSLGVQPSEGLREFTKTMSLTQAAKYFQSEYALEKNIEEIMAGVNAMIRDFYLYRAELKSNVKELLEHFHSRNVKMCIATATDKELVEAALRRCGIRKYFLDVFTCESVGAGKDEPVIYERALEALNTSKEATFVFEDALYAARTAKAAGFKVVGVFDKEEKEPQKLERIVDVYVKKFDGRLSNILVELK